MTRANEPRGLWSAFRWWYAAVVLGLLLVILPSGSALADDASVSLSPVAGTATTVITASWDGFDKKGTVTVTDSTVNVGTLCSGSSNGSGKGSCSWTITTSEAANQGNHTIRATDGATSATTGLFVITSVDGLGTDGLLLLTVVLAALGAYRLQATQPWSTPAPARDRSAARR